MRQNQASITAAGIALARAIESAKPAGERICYDPFARRFISGAFYHFTSSLWISGTRSGKAPA